MMLTLFKSINIIVTLYSNQEVTMPAAKKKAPAKKATAAKKPAAKKTTAKKK